MYLPPIHEERDTRLPWLGIDARWNALRGDDRFQALLARLGLPAGDATARF